MDNIESVSEIYSIIEKETVPFYLISELGNHFMKLRDKKHKENKLDEIGILQWEIDVFNFVIRENKVTEMFSGTNAKGEVVSYPTMAKFNDDAFDYISKRMNDANNPLLKSRYAHILWASPKKHAKYANVAIDNYLQLAKIYEHRDIEYPQEHSMLSVIDSIKNAFLLSRQIQYRENDVMQEINGLILTDICTKGSIDPRWRLLEFINENAENIPQEDKHKYLAVCDKISMNALEDNNYHSAIDICRLASKIESSMGVNSNKWLVRTAEAYEGLLGQSEKNNKMASLSFCQDCIEVYKMLKMPEKVKHYEKKYSELKKHVRYSEFKQEIDLTEHINKCRRIADELIKKDTDYIIITLAMDKSLLPNLKEMKEQVKKNDQEFIAQKLFPMQLIDQDGNNVQNVFADEEKEYYHILVQYGFEMQFSYSHLLREIFFAGIKSGKLSTATFLAFIANKSWLGKNISQEIAGKTIIHNWMNLIAPAVNDYFSNMQCYFANHENIPTFILSIDSLTLKIEGMLRDMCHFSGVPTSYITKDSQGRRIAHEKDIHALLYEEAIKKLFDEEDLLFFRFLLVEKAGYNLRHKIAHSLMHYEGYDITYIHLLLISILKLGKYDFETKQ